jgi:hypothetical protein
MGHLINPIAMRLGRFSYWEDFWFVDYLYYPEFLHLLMKIKSFFLFFFSLKFVERGGYLYSHFIILKCFKAIVIRVYFFNGMLDEFVEDFFWNCWRIFFEDESYLENRDRYYLSPKFMNSFRLLMIFRAISYFSYNKLLMSRRSIYKFVGMFGRYNYRLLFKRFRLSFHWKWKLSKVRGQRVRFLFLFFVLRRFLYIYYKNALKTKKHNMELDYAFVRGFFVDNWFMEISFYLNKFFFVFLPCVVLGFDFFFRVDYFVLANEYINAKFLSRFVARKLQQGYRLMHVIYPIKRELKRVMTVLKKFRLRKNLGKGKIVGTFFFKNFVIKVFNLLFKLCKNEICKFYVLNHCWFGFDSLVLFYWMRITFLKVEELVGLSFFFFVYKIGFFLLFCDNGFLMKDFFRLNFRNNVNFFKIYSNINNFCVCLDNVFMFIFNLNLLFFDYLYSFLNNVPLLKLLIYFYNSYLRGYLIFQIYVSSCQLKPNNFVKPVIPGLFGFRLKLAGRFSRKQKASSILYSVGNIPLVTLKANIDYSFYTIPLKNSAISVKIWLYRNWSLKETDLVKHGLDRNR